MPIQLEVAHCSFTVSLTSPCLGEVKEGSANHVTFLSIDRLLSAIDFPLSRIELTFNAIVHTFLGIDGIRSAIEHAFLSFNGSVSGIDGILSVSDRALRGMSG